MHELIINYGLELQTVFSKVDIRLFGSYLNHKATYDSGIDIAVISRDFNGIDSYVAMKILNRLRRKVPDAVLIEAIPFGPEEFARPAIGSLAYAVAQSNDLVFKAEY